MTTQPSPSDPTELQKAIEHADSQFKIAGGNPCSVIAFNSNHIAVLLSAAKRSIEVESIARKLTEALKPYAQQNMWTEHVIDSYSGLCWFFDWEGNLQDKPFEVADKALTIAKENNLL